MEKLLRNIYYPLKKFIPRKFQIGLRQMIARQKLKKNLDTWPIDESAKNHPENWNGWPENKKFALILTHDIDTAEGYSNIKKLLEFEKEKGFVSSFNFVPERDYRVSKEMINYVTKNGFEVGVHGLTHDGKLYDSKKIFYERAEKIKEYLKEWKSVGFRSPAMHHNLEWIADLDILYDSSTFDTDPFEPQPDGVKKIFPFKVKIGEKEYVELPYTLPQDFTLFILMKEQNINIWKKKLDWIAKNGGMVLLNVHPDYINFKNEKNGTEQYSAKHYENFLNYVSEAYNGQYWNILPKEIALWEKERNQKV